jgi:hypothetical protein
MGRKLRDYIAFLDDGHDHSDFKFSSIYRNGSKAIKDDCMAQLSMNYGWKSAHRWTIKSIERLEDF